MPPQQHVQRQSRSAKTRMKRQRPTGEDTEELILETRASLQAHACRLRNLIQRGEGLIRAAGRHPPVTPRGVSLCATLEEATLMMEDCVGTSDLASTVFICQRILTFASIRAIPFPPHGLKAALTTVAKIIARVAEWLHLRGA
jgi:hypothetical protein